MQAADSVGEHQRGGEHEGRGERRVDAGRRGQPRDGPGQQDQADQCDEAVPDHQQPRVAGLGRGQVTEEERDRTVRRHGVHPALVDRLDDRSVQRHRPVLVRRQAQVGEHALGGVGPAVPREQRRRQHQRRAPHDGGVPDHGQRVVAILALGHCHVAAQGEPLPGQQSESQQDQRQCGYPAGLGAAQVEEHFGVHQRVLRGRVDTTSPPSSTSTPPTKPRISTWAT